MSRNFLQLMQAAANELGIPQPSQVIGATDDQSLQLIAIANREGKDFSRLANGNGGWQKLHKEYSFTTSATSLTGNTTEGSAVITGISSTAGLVASTWGATADGLPYPARISSVDSATQVTLDTEFSESQTGVTVTFAQLAYALPSDFEYFVYRTEWDGAYQWELVGPINAPEKQLLRYGLGASGPRRKFYVRNNLVWLDPLPSDGEVIAYDYYSNAWCSSSGGTAQALWADDTDLYLLDEDCFILGVKKRFRRAKGLDYAQEDKDYSDECDIVMGRDGGVISLPLSGGTYGARLLDEDNIPESGYGE